MKIFTAPAILSRISFTADGGLSIGFTTQEINAEEKIKASEFHQHFGWLLFKDSEFSVGDIPKDDPTDEDKSPSQRLRAALYVLWQQRGERGEFESFYRINLEKAISRVKNLLK